MGVLFYERSNIDFFSEDGIWTDLRVEDYKLLKILKESKSRADIQMIDLDKAKASG